MSIAGLILGGATTVRAGMSGLFGGGPFYVDAATNIAEVKNSGFQEVIVWNIAVSSNGDLNFNGGFPICAGGLYIGGSMHPDFAGNMSVLKQGSVKRVTFSIGSSNVGDWQHIRDLVNSQGTGSGSILYRNFQALKNAIPALDAIDFDDENCYDQNTMVQFAVMLSELGYKVALDPYMNTSFWTSVASQVNSQRPGTVDAVHLQCYSGGSGNNPCSWDFGGIPVYPGCDASDGVDTIQNKMSNWQYSCGISGGWVWLLDQIKGHAASYAIAINNGLGIDTPVSGRFIGINFSGRQWSSPGGNVPESLNAADTAGVISQTNWNNLDPAGYNSGTQAQITGPNTGVISDNSGAATGLTFNYSAQSMWSVSQTTYTGNQQLMNGYSDVEGNDSNIGIYAVSNISYTLYDVYVYITADDNGRTAGVGLNGGPQVYLKTNAKNYNFSNPMLEGQAASQVGATNAHYVCFHNVSGSGFEVGVHRYGLNVGVAGIQIVDTSAHTFMTTPADSLGNISFDAYNTAFLIKTNGLTYYKTSLADESKAYFWLQALEIQLAEDAYERNPSADNKQLVSDLLLTFLAQNNGSDWSWNNYNDDLAWANIAFIRGYQITGNATFRNVAVTNWNLAYNRGWDSTLGGGIWWDVAHTDKGALSNDPTIIAGCGIYQATGDSSYLTKCQAIYSWVRSHLFDTNSGVVNGGVKPDGTLEASDDVFQSGAFVNAANALYQITGNVQYFNDAILAANHVVNKNGILNHWNREENCWEDQFMRGLTYLCRDNNLWNVYYPWMAANAKAAWDVRRTDLNITWNDWTWGTPLDDCSSLECVSAAVVQQLLPTEKAGGPVFTLQPADQVSAVGNAVILSSLATNNGSIFYQWYHGTNPVDAAQSSNLVLASVKNADSGNYWVVASNSVGSAFSQVAHVVLFGMTNIVAIDSGSNYMINTPFGNQNQGSGFGPWVLSIPGGGDFITSSGVFDLWNSTPLASSTATRTFNAPLAVGGAFSVLLKNQTLEATNISGFQLEDANGNPLFKFYWQGGDTANGHFTDARGNIPAVGYSFNSGNFSSFTFTLNSATTYTFADITTARTFSGILSGAPIVQVRFFRINNGSESLSYGQDFQFDKLKITVPSLTPNPTPITLTPIHQGWLGKFSVVPGYFYRVQRSTNLPGQWMDLIILVGPVNGLSQFLDTNPPPVSAFYRTVTP